MTFRSTASFLFVCFLTTCTYGFTQSTALIDVCFQSSWFPQAEFVGYFVARDLGFYEDEGLNIEILDGGTVNPVTNVAVGNCDFGIDSFANIVAQRERGLDVVQIAQIFKKSGYRLVALKDSGIEELADIAGRTVGVWGYGNEFYTEAVFEKLGLTADLDPTVVNPDVETVVYAFDPALVFPNEVEVVSAMMYNELNQLVAMGYPLDDLVVLDPSVIGADIVEGNLFTTNKLLDVQNLRNSGLSGREIARRFLKATLRGWEYAAVHYDQVLKIVLDSCGDTCKGSGEQSAAAHQAWQLRQVLSLVKPSPDVVIGAIDQGRFVASVQLLRDIGVLSTTSDVGDAVDTSIIAQVVDALK